MAKYINTDYMHSEPPTYTKNIKSGYKGYASVAFNIVSGQRIHDNVQLFSHNTFISSFNRDQKPHQPLILNCSLEKKMQRSASL
jgi:hypothetical protein